MATKAPKEPYTHEDQLQKLISRGCVIDDQNEAIDLLKKTNYYRLTAYFLPFKNHEGHYKEGTNLYSIFKIHEFDRELGHLLFGAVMPIELRLRTQVSYHHAHKYGALGYTDHLNFNSMHKHKKFMDNVKKNVKWGGRQLFVRHHNELYGGEFPLWVVIELFSLGELSLFYSDMKTADKKAVSRLYGTTHTNLSSWLWCLTILRNYCAHYSRLYYNSFPTVPATPKDFLYTMRKMVFDYILTLKFLYHGDEEQFAVFRAKLEVLLEEYGEYISLPHIGFPANWSKLLNLAPSTYTPAPTQARSVGAPANLTK